MDAKYVSLLSQIKDPAIQLALREILKDMDKLKGHVKAQKTA